MNIPLRLQPVAKKLETGHLHAALSELESLYDDRRPVDRTLKAELLLHVGNWDEAEALSRTVPESRAATADIKARALEHLGYVKRHRGNVREAISLWEQSLHLARKCDDVEQTCRSQLHLLAAKADSYGADALGTLPADVRSSVMRSGDPHLWLWLHWRFAEVEARKAAFRQAERHIQLGKSILARHPCLWLEARLHLLHGVIASGTSNLDCAINHFQRALDVARQSGVAFVESAALANLGDIYTSSGKFELARTHLETALTFTRPWPTLRPAVLHTLAKLELLDGRYSECEALLGAWTAPQPGTTYAELEGGLIRVGLLQRRGELDDALQIAETLMNAAQARSAYMLVCQFQLAMADILVDLGRLEDARRLFRQIDIGRSGSALGLVAEVERVQARVAAKAGTVPVARAQFERAARILAFLGHEASRSSLLKQMEEEFATSDDNHHTETTRGGYDSSSLLSAMASVARMIDFGAHPELLGQELLSLLVHSDAATRAAVTCTRDDNRLLVHQFNSLNVDWLDDTTPVTKLSLGTIDGATYDLFVHPSPRFGAGELLSPLADLLARSLELCDARREHFQRASLWPVEIPLQDDGTVVSSPKMRECHVEAVRVSKTELPILITGDTGVGKEVVARAIHNGSRRASKRFEAINCAAIPRELFEGHLFGYRRGAFTGAVNDSLGIIRGNNGGTIFLDEIGELSLDMQVKLLRVLDAREIHPLGATQSIPVDVRIIAATNANLPQMIEEKRFRDDLFYRLNAVSIRIPPLRDRREEIMPLAHQFLSTFCARNERPLLQISDEALEYLLLYNWPGNIRELKNEMERLAGLVDGMRIKPADLKQEILAARRTSPAVECGPDDYVVRIDRTLEEAYEDLSRHMVIEALKKHNGHIGRAAKQVGLTRKGLFNKRLRFGLV